MAYYGPGGYGTPPFPPYDNNTPSQSQAPPQDFPENTGEFTLTQNFPPWTEAGSTSRFYMAFVHNVDGAIEPQSVAIAFLDGNGNAVATGTATGITPTAVLYDPAGSNKAYSSVQFGANLPPGNYVVVWTGTYTPDGSATALSITSKQSLLVKATQAPSQYYFVDTAHA